MFAQQTITVVSNVKVTFSEKRGTYRWYNPVFAHEGNTLSADSADYNQGDNFFDAYGNVVITQPNGTVAHAEKLHYTESTQEAILTNNVRLIDRQAILTTNFLTYNMRTKIGTYVNGGQILNGKDTLTSKNGYYFENSQDAYFRHNVVVKTPDVKIHTDTLRYNSGSKMTYFYGPTTIDGKNGRLYTENGDYNTETDKARFGKNNLYTEGSKFLWGDSLLYDGKSGNGRAVKNVNFVDTTQHIVMRGQLGTYTKATQATLVTQNAYIVLATKSDSTGNNAEKSTQRDSLVSEPKASTKPKLPIDSTEIKFTRPRDSLNIELMDSSQRTSDSIGKPETTRMDSTYMSADTLFSQVIKLKDYKYTNLKMSREGGELEEEEINEVLGEGSTENNPEKPTNTLSRGGRSVLGKDSLSTKDSTSVTSMQTDIPIDSIGAKVDSLNRPLNPAPDSLKNSTLKRGIDSVAQVTGKEVIQKVANSAQDSLKATGNKPKVAESLPSNTVTDTTSYAIDSISSVLPKKGDVDSLINQATKTALANHDSDSLVSDTAETRIVIAYHDVRIFKSDLQAIADSAYFGYPDSIIRCFGKPMFWAQGSQLSADTIYMQLKNQKMDNMLLQNKAFVVSTELDSTKYNQVKGKKIAGFFSNNKLDRISVDGNAESIYYTVENNKFTGMARSISGRIKVLFSDNKMTDVISIRKASTTYYPISKAPDDQEFLEGFIWKPELRPKSKEEVINRTHSRRDADLDEHPKSEELLPSDKKEHKEDKKMLKQENGKEMEIKKGVSPKQEEISQGESVQKESSLVLEQKVD